MKNSSILEQANSHIEDIERLLSLFQDTTNRFRIGKIKHDLQETRRNIYELERPVGIKPELEGSGITSEQQQRIRKMLYHFLQSDSEVSDLIDYYNNKTDWIDQVGWITLFSDTEGIYINKIRLLTTSYLIRDQEEEG